MAAPSDCAVITIVGSGFAGTVLALHLARQCAGLKLEINLIEPREAPGPGLAYSAPPPEYLLNVRAGALSLWPGEPAHFARWLTGQCTGPAPDFAPRGLYGRYVAEQFAALAAAPPAGVRVRWHQTRAVAAPPLPDGRRAVHLATGEVVESDVVVLALGNFPPPPPAGPDLRYLQHPGYHANPWARGTLETIGPDDAVLLVGSGLTAVDVLLALHQHGHRAPVRVVARHGRWPAAHGPADEPAYPNFYPELAAETTVLGVLSAVRRHLARAAAQGLSWRAVLDALRPDLGRIWAGWPLAEQARFLRHLAGLWTAARHRSPPQNAAALADLEARGLLHTEIGRVSEILPDGDNLRVGVDAPGRPRAYHTARHVVCCAGPLLDYARIEEPLVAALRAAGHLVPDPLRLGMRTDAHGALLDAHGHPVPGLFTLGASRRPAYFESTAVPELRQQAAALAAELCRRLGQ